MRPRRPNVQFRLSAPLGYTRVSVGENGDDRAVRDRYSDGHAFQASAMAGVDVSGSNSGAYLNFEFTARFFGRDHTTTLVSDPAVSATERQTVTDRSLMMVAGFLYHP